MHYDHWLGLKIIDQCKQKAVVVISKPLTSSINLSTDMILQLHLNHLVIILYYEYDNLWKHIVKT